MSDGIGSIKMGQRQCDSTDFVYCHMRNRGLWTLGGVDCHRFSALDANFVEKNGKSTGKLVQFRERVSFDCSVVIFMDERQMVCFLVACESPDCIRGNVGM